MKDVSIPVHVALAACKGIRNAARFYEIGNPEYAAILMETADVLADEISNQCSLEEIDAGIIACRLQESA